MSTTDSISSLPNMSGVDLLSEYDFALCSDDKRLRESLELRMEVFHLEQKFPAETEIDEYEPISAHFIITRRKDSKIVATVRLTPFPRKEWLSNKNTQNENELKQNETSVVTSGGGPGGTSGGLPIFSGAKDEESDNLPAQKTEVSLPESSDDTNARMQYPLGKPIPLLELRRMFTKAAEGKGKVEEEHGAPNVRGAKVSRLAVSKTERGRGLGALIMQQIEGWLLAFYIKEELLSQTNDKSHSPSSPPPPFNVVISSQQHAVPFYEKLGYSVFGQPYDEEGAPHNWCVKRLASSTNDPNAGK